MASARLKVYHPDGDSHQESGDPAIPIRLVDLYPLLARAYRENYTWLDDFSDDELLVSPDLYEVVRAFSDYRPSA